MRLRRGNVDRNQVVIVRELRQMGCSVAVTTSVVNGFPDIVVGKDGKNHLFEIKDPNQPPNKRRLTPAEKQFHESWRGQIAVVESTEEALREMKR